MRPDVNLNMKHDIDLIVVGSGAGGLSTAVTAAHLGLKVLVLEKEAYYGGTTAWSGGWMWIPRNPLALEAGIIEDNDAPMTYLRHELGSRFELERARMFLENGPRMVNFFRARTALQFIDGNVMPDFHGKAPGAAIGGRSLCAAPFDGRRLGQHIRYLKSPLPETTLWGMGIAGGAELRHFYNALRQPASFWHVSKLVLHYGCDLILHQRSMRLVNGNALVAGLAASAYERGVEIRVNSPVQRLVLEQGRIAGVVVNDQCIRARCGVVLACGGFPHDQVRKQQLLPHAPSGHEHFSAAALGNTGDGLRLGETVGGRVGCDQVQAAALAPVSLVPRVDGTVAHFPHLLERAKPGLIAVTASGQRFTNEADSYHDFVQSLLRVTVPGQTPQAWLVCDHDFIRRYGLGAVKPAPMRLNRMLKNGYLKRGNSLSELAQACGISALGLEQTVSQYNQQALIGKDSEFGKGETPYNRGQGDQHQRNTALPNPCMAPIESGPFYAVRIVAGSLGTFAGLEVNLYGQVLDAQNQPLPGLYAAGNDMNSMMGGHYPSGGITLGPAMTFGFIVAHHAAGVEADIALQPVSNPDLSNPINQH